MSGMGRSPCRRREGLHTAVHPAELRIESVGVTQRGRTGKQLLLDSELWRNIAAQPPVAQQGR